MARLSNGVVLVSDPVRTFPNGDFFYVEMSRRNARYHCVLKMACTGGTEDAVVVVQAEGKTVREAEDACYRKALERCPRFPRPPYLTRGRKRRVAIRIPISVPRR